MIDVWFASVTVGQAGHRAVLERRAHLDEAGDVRGLARGGHRRRGRSGWCRRTGSRRRAGAAAARGRARRGGPRRPGRRGRCRSVVPRGAAEQRGDRRGDVDEPRRTRRRRPSARTPLPAITNGARAWTTPSEPCSPRWPPWSSQLCAAEWITQRSGAAGWSKSWAVVVEGERVGVLAPVRVTVRHARRRAPANRSVDWSANGFAPVHGDVS